jgi:hypothetical protein
VHLERCYALEARMDNELSIDNKDFPDKKRFSHPHMEVRRGGHHPSSPQKNNKKIKK